MSDLTPPITGHFFEPHIWLTKICGYVDDGNAMVCGYSPREHRSPLAILDACARDACGRSARQFCGWSVVAVNSPRVDAFCCRLCAEATSDHVVLHDERCQPVALPAGPCDMTWSPERANRVCPLTVSGNHLCTHHDETRWGVPRTVHTCACGSDLIVRNI